ncbi:MAG: hypothetical protein IPM69_12860 [Ignavibacteria bacterium]|nr:hypothetical protein [Ignavibacteria bacterium]
MKYIVTLLLLFTMDTTFAQSSFPGFLEGTWKVENKEQYERWDKLNESSLRGFSYSMKNGQMIVSEYLEVAELSSVITYSASVLRQNQGKPIPFILTKTDSVYSFENPLHDFPKKIAYHKKSDTEMYVQVSDGGKKGFSFTMHKQVPSKPINDTMVKNQNYNPVLAQKLGGDDYGMKGYVLVLLKTGTNLTTDKTLINNSFRGHMENINLLVKEGKMIVAGPLGKNDKTYRGIFILNVKTIEEAKSLLQNDTAIKEGLLDYELYNWFGSAALPEYLDASDKIWKVKP